MSRLSSDLAYWSFDPQPHGRPPFGSPKDTDPGLGQNWGSRPQENDIQTAYTNIAIEHGPFIVDLPIKIGDVP